MITCIITSIVIIALFILGIYLKGHPWYEFTGFCLTYIFGWVAIFHFAVLLFVKYDYEKFLNKRNAFQQTLIEARENGREIESAAILQNVAEWNIDLAEYQYDNTTWLLDQYIDDRIMSLKPIK